ncbi:hypothetical protein KCU91_g2687, partial [Aureobasidium melanogenum]
MRASNTAFVSILFVVMSHVAWSQDCDLIDQQACCYADDGSDSNATYCCNGSIVGNFGSGSDASALNDLICCQDDGRTGLSVGLDFTTCRAGSATPLTAKGTAAGSVADAIKSISASRSASRESLFSSASVSRASVAAAASSTAISAGASSTSRSATPISTGPTGIMSSSGGLAASSSSSVSRSEFGSSSSAAAADTTSSSSGTTTAATSIGSAAAVTSSSTSTGGVAMMTMDAWNAAMAGGFALVAAVL